MMREHLYKEIDELVDKFKGYDSAMIVNHLLKPIMMNAYTKNVFRRNDAVMVAAAVVTLIDRSESKESTKEPEKEPHYDDVVATSTKNSDDDKRLSEFLNRM